jgi:hypothetical protein
VSFQTALPGRAVVAASARVWSMRLRNPYSIVALNRYHVIRSVERPGSQDLEEVETRLFAAKGKAFSRRLFLLLELPLLL